MTKARWAIAAAIGAGAITYLVTSSPLAAVLAGVAVSFLARVVQARIGLGAYRRATLLSRRDQSPAERRKLDELCEAATVWGRYFDTRLSPIERINSLSPEDRWLAELIDETVEARDQQVFADVVCEGLRRGRPAGSWPRFRTDVIERFNREIVADRLSKGGSTTADSAAAERAARGEAAELTTYVFLRDPQPLADEPLAIALASAALAHRVSTPLVRGLGSVVGDAQAKHDGGPDAQLRSTAPPDSPDRDSASSGASSGAMLRDDELGDDDKVDEDEAASRSILSDLGVWAPDVSDHFVLDAGGAKAGELCWQITSRTQWTFDPEGIWTTPGTEDQRTWIVDVATFRSGKWSLDPHLSAAFDSADGAYEYANDLVNG